ncbi:MAG: hypothetical protein U0Y68_18370 [Blastocatellia bacterium]
MKKASPDRPITTKLSVPRPGKREKSRGTSGGYLRSIYMGSAQAVYELQRQAAVSGAGTPSNLIRIWSNKAKSQYNERLTLLEQEIIEQAKLGNNEVAGLLVELRQTLDNSLTADYLQLALNSLVERRHLICAQRGGKTEKARGAKVRCYFLQGSPLGSDFSIARAGSNYEGEED